MRWLYEDLNSFCGKARDGEPCFCKELFPLVLQWISPGEECSAGAVALAWGEVGASSSGDLKLPLVT